LATVFLPTVFLARARETAPVAKAKEPANPFYVLVIVLGVVFLVTACGYGTMTYRAIAPAPREGAPHDGADHPLMAFLDHYGMELLGGELLLLAGATVGAMGLDRYRTLRDGELRDG
jgi:hypothetical protein